MSLWHGVLRAHLWGTLCGGAEGRECGEKPLLLAFCTLVTQPRARTLLTALSRTVAFTAECPSAKHSDWMLTLVLSLLQWAVETSHLCSSIPCQDLITSSPRVAKGHWSSGRSGRAEPRDRQAVDVSASAPEIKVLRRTEALGGRSQIGRSGNAARGRMGT